MTGRQAGWGTRREEENVNADNLVGVQEYAVFPDEHGMDRFTSKGPFKGVSSKFKDGTITQPSK